MVEVEHERVALDALHDAGDRLAVGRGKADDVADAVVAVGIAFGVERRSADAMDQRGIALAERFAGGVAKVSTNAAPSPSRSR